MEFLLKEASFANFSLVFFYEKSRQNCVASKLTNFDEFLFINYRTETVMKSAMVEFKLGQMIEEITIDGRKMKTTFKVVLLQHEPSGAEFYALAQFQRDSNDNIIEIFRFVRHDNLQVIMRINNTTAFAVFEPLE